MGAVSLMVMIPAFQAGGPGSIPGRRILQDFPLFSMHPLMLPQKDFPRRDSNPGLLGESQVS